MAKQVSTTYGDALFELACEEQQMDAFYEEATGLLQVFSENDELTKLLAHPKVLKEEKIAFLEKIFKGKISDAMLGFLTIIVKKDRQVEIGKIFEYFIKRVKEYKNIGVASVTSARPLSDDQKAKIEARLLETTSYKSIEASYEVREELIGGLVIRIEDRVMDSSIRSQLRTMKKTLLA